jgi:hypothetical protein
MLTDCRQLRPVEERIAVPVVKENKLFILTGSSGLLRRE